MLKQILATSALMAIAGFSVQSAVAADASKFRQLVIEPAGTPAAVADAGNLDASKRQRLIIAPAEDIPTNSADAGEADQLLIAPGKGIDTQVAPGEANGKKPFPAPAQISDSTATPVKLVATAEPIPAAAGKGLPGIAPAPKGFSTSVEIAAAVADDAGAPIAPKAAIAIAPIAPVADEETGAAPAAPAPVAISSPKDLYLLLTGRGYGVKFLKRDAYDNPIFYVTIPGKAEEGELILVDETDGKVLKRKHVTVYADAHPAAPAPRYPAVADENCPQTIGY